MAMDGDAKKLQITTTKHEDGFQWRGVKYA